jgi:hypothetical protein
MTGECASSVEILQALVLGHVNQSMDFRGFFLLTCRYYFNAVMDLIR